MIEELLTKINEITGGNQFMAAALSAWMLGVATFVLRKVPEDTLRLIKKHLTTSITLTSQHVSFYSLMQWFESHGYSKKFRRVKVTNGKWGDSDTATKAVGYGRHLIWWHRMPMIIELSRIDSNSDREKEELILSKFGRNHKIFDQLLIDIKDSDGDIKMTKIRKFNSEGYWALVKQPRRDMDSVFMPAADRTQLLKALEEFKRAEKWYVEHGIPYQLGILLYGPPGTGKTSLIRAIASYMDCGIDVVPAQQLYKVSEFGTDKDILVIEDVDSNTMTQDREKKSDEGDLKTMLCGGISEILNALDGVVISHGRVIVMTTNHIEKLDPALVRPGRVDLKLSLGYVTPEVLSEFVKAFFGATIPKGEMSRDITVAELQNMILLGKPLDTIIRECYTVYRKVE